MNDYNAELCLRGIVALQRNLAIDDWGESFSRNASGVRARRLR